MTKLFGASRPQHKCLRLFPGMILLALAAVLVGAAPVLAAGGSLDFSFGDGGKVITDLRKMPTPDQAQAVAVQPDGKIVAVGFTDTSDGFNTDFAVTRYNSNGTLDTDFGANGKVTTDFNGYSDFGHAVVLSGGKITVAGYCGSLNNSDDFALARYNSNGSLDGSFGIGGKMTVDLGLAERATAMAFDGDKLVIAGIAYDYANGDSDIIITRHNSGGSLDAGFGSGGALLGDYGNSEGAGAVVVEHGKITVAASTVGHTGGYADLLVARYNSDGSLDPFFGTAGKVVTDLGFSESPTAMALDNGKVVVAGSTPYSLWMVRYHGNGSPDLSFSGDGSLTGSGGFAPQGYDLLIDNGRYVVAANTWNGSNEDFLVRRYLNDGSLDTSYGSNGQTVTDLGGTDYGNAAAIAFGKVVVVGVIYTATEDIQHSDIGIARYNSDGSLDTSLAGDGTIQANWALRSSSDRVAGAVVQADGKVISVGGTGTAQDRDFFVARHNPDGSLDTTFGNGGYVVTDFGTDGFRSYDEAVAVVLDGAKIVVAGMRNSSFACARYNSNGTLDSAFSGDGKIFDEYNGEYEGAEAVAVYGGKVVIAGLTYVNNQADILVKRYNNDGSVDTSFSGDGRETTDLGSRDWPSAVAIEGGKIIVAGSTNHDFFVLRYNFNGTLDTGFGSGGKTITNLGNLTVPTPTPTPTTRPSPSPSPSPVGSPVPTPTPTNQPPPPPPVTPGPTAGPTIIPTAPPPSSYTQDSANAMVLDGGKLIVAGNSDSLFAMVRYNQNGTVDKTFGNAGKAVVAGQHSLQGTAVAAGGGSIILAGTLDGDFAVARFSSEGVQDTSFGEQGLAIADFGGYESAEAVKLYNGKIVVAGTANSNFGDIALARFLPGSAPATLFSIQGRVANGSGEGLAGAGLSLSNGRQVSTDRFGNFNFPNVAPGSYTIKPILVPSLAGVTFTPAQLSATVTNRNLFNRNFTASFTVRGKIANHSGAGMAGITVKLGESRQASTDSSGNFVFTNVGSGTYAVAPVITPSLTGVTFFTGTPSITVSKSNVGNVNFTASFVVSGRVVNHSGTGIPNVQVQRVAGTSVVSVVTDPAGNFRFSDVRSGSYTLSPVLTPAMTGMSFTPASRSLTVDRTNIANQSFIGMFSVSGRIATSAGSGIPNILVRLSNGSTSTTVQTDVNGAYRFGGVRSGTYSITPTQSGRTFAPASRDGVVVSTQNVPNQSFTGSGQ